jgi:hypothetical protein
VWFAGVTGLQLILGVILYLIPQSFAQMALLNLPTSLRDPQQRFFLTEHTVVMFVAVILAQVAAGASRRAPVAQAKFRRAAILSTISLLLILLAIPWPFLSYGRPWIRLG